jgi:glyoxylate utilization-related uncharacterized protein
MAMVAMQHVQRHGKLVRQGNGVLRLQVAL